MKLLERKQVLITGGGRGIGKAVAIEFAKNGADVAVASRTESELNQTKKEIKNYGGQCIAITVDLSTIEGVKDCVTQYFKNFEQCDIQRQ